MIGGGGLGLGILVSMKDAFSANAHKIEASMKSLDATVTSGADRMSASLERIQRGTMMMGAGAALLALPVALVAATAATQKALGEVSSVGVKDLRALEDAAESFTNQWAGTTKAEFIAAAYDVKSALSALSDEAVGTFSQMAALTAKATKATTGEMVGTFTTAYGIFKPIMSELSDMDWAKAFSGAMSQTVASFKTTGVQMADAIKNVGATAAASNVPLAEQLAILGQLQTTMPGSEAGTLYKSFILHAAEAGDELGLSFVDATGRLRGVLPILQEIQSKFRDLAQAAAQVELKKAFRSDEALKFVLQMSQGTEALEGNIQSISRAMKNGTAVTEEMAQAMNQDIGSQFVLVRQQVANLAEILGRSLLPVVIPVLHGIQKGILGLQQLAKAAPVLTRAVLTLSVALGAVLVVVGGAIAAFGTIGLLLPAVTAGIAGFGAAVASAGGLIATWFWPVTLVIGAVALAVYGLKRAWEADFAGIRSTLVGWWEKVRLVGVAVRTLISSLASGKGRMSAALANQLEGAGLMGFVIGIFRAYYRVREALTGIRSGFQSTFGMIRAILEPAVRGLFGAFGSLGQAIRPLLAALGLASVAADAGRFRTLGEAIGRVVGAVAIVGATLVRFLVLPMTLTFRAIAAVVGALVWLGRTVATVLVATGRFAYQFVLPVRMLVEGFRLAARVLGTVWDVVTGNVSVIDGVRAVGEAIGSFLVAPFVWVRDVSVAAIGTIRSLFSSTSGVIASIAGALRAVFSELGIVRAIREAFAAVVAFLSGDVGFVEVGRRVVFALARGVASAATLPMELAAKIASGIASRFGVDLSALGRKIMSSLVGGMSALLAAPERVLRAALEHALGAARSAFDALLALGEGLFVGLLRPLGFSVEPIRRFFASARQGAEVLWARLEEGGSRLVAALTWPWRAVRDVAAAAWQAIAGGSAGAAAGVRAMASASLAVLDQFFPGFVEQASRAWRAVADSADSAWASLGRSVRQAFQLVGELISPLVSSVAAAWANVPAALSGAWEGIRSAIGDLVGAAFDGGRAILTSLADGIRATVAAPYQAVKVALERVRDLLPFSDAREGPLASLTMSGRSLLKTFSTGVARSEASPARAVEKAFARISALNRTLAAPAVVAGTLALTPAIAGSVPKVAPPVPPAVGPVVAGGRLPLAPPLALPSLPVPSVIPNVAGAPLPAVVGELPAPPPVALPLTPPAPSRLLAETRGSLAASTPDGSYGSPGSDVRELLEAILRKLDALAERPITLSVTTKLDGREIARAVYQDLRERRVQNYETF